MVWGGDEEVLKTLEPQYFNSIPRAQLETLRQQTHSPRPRPCPIRFQAKTISMRR